MSAPRKDAVSRRKFLKWVGIAPGVAGLGIAAGNMAGCAEEADSGALAGNTGGGVDPSPVDAGGRAGSDAGGAISPDASAADASAPDGSGAPQDSGSGTVEDASADSDAILDAEAADAGDWPVDASIPADTSGGGGGYPIDPGDTWVESDVAPTECLLTGEDVLGPYYEAGAPMTTQLATAEEPGERLRIKGTVYGPDCTTPLPGVLLDVWQADEGGEYHGADEDYRLRGQLLTGDDGTYVFETIVPGRYAMSGTFRPAHIHFMVSKPGYAPITTQLYFEGDPFLPPEDPCGGCNSDDPTLVMPLVELSDDPAGIEKEGVFDIILGDAP